MKPHTTIWDLAVGPADIIEATIQFHDEPGQPAHTLRIQGRHLRLDGRRVWSLSKRRRIRSGVTLTIGVLNDPETFPPGLRENA